MTVLKRNTDITLEHTTYLVDSDGAASTVTPDSISVEVTDALGNAVTVPTPTAGDPSTLAITETVLTDSTVGPITVVWTWTYGTDTTEDVEVYELVAAPPAALYDTWGEIRTRIRRELEEPVATVWADESLRVWAFEAASALAFTMRLPEPYEFTTDADAVQVPRHCYRGIVAYVLSNAFSQVADDAKAMKHMSDYERYLNMAYMRYARGVSSSPTEVW